MKWGGGAGVGRVGGEILLTNDLQRNIRYPSECHHCQIWLWLFLLQLKRCRRVLSSVSGVSGAGEPSQPWVCTRSKRGGSPRETAISYPTEKTPAGIAKGKGPTSSARPCVGRGPLRAPLSPIRMEMPKGLLKMWVGPPECTAGVSKQQVTGQIQMHLSLKMKLYWNTTTPFHLHVAHGCFCSMAQS